MEGNVVGEGHVGKEGDSVGEIKRVSEPIVADAELPSHLEKMFGRAENQQTGEQGVVLKQLFVEYGDIFAKHKMDLGEFSEVTHKIEVGEVKPVQCRPRRIPLAFEGGERAPLHALKEGKQPFNWGEEKQTAFKKLKKRLTEALVLLYPREGGGFILDIDASDKAIGGVLSQTQDGEERVVGYGSYVLSAPQQNYCVTRKELLAVVTVMQTNRHYLLGNHFSVRIENGSLVWIKNFKNIEGQLAQ